LIDRLSLPGGYVFTLFACYLAGLCRNYPTDFCSKIRRKGFTWASEETVRFRRL